ncbi:MAG: peptidase S8, partial [Clostridium sp.]|nr:peptidase S8 [Clostridium sp.]
VNTMTVGINNKIDIINGTSLAAAIGAGACVLLFEWGIVDKNYPYMYSQSIKTFLNRGTLKRPGDMYPNPQLGYGIINFYKIFENMI